MFTYVESPTSRQKEEMESQRIVLICLFSFSRYCISITYDSVYVIYIHLFMYRVKMNPLDFCSGLNRPQVLCLGGLKKT